MNKEAVEVSSVLSASASIVSHCLSKHYNLVNPGCEDYRCWLAMLTSLCQQLEPPYELEVCDTFVTGFAVVSVFLMLLFFLVLFLFILVIITVSWFSLKMWYIIGCKNHKTFWYEFGVGSYYKYIFLFVYLSKIKQCDFATMWFCIIISWGQKLGRSHARSNF